MKLENEKFVTAYIAEMDHIIDKIKSELENSTFKFISANNLRFKLLETGFISTSFPSITISKPSHCPTPPPGGGTNCRKASSWS